MKTFTTAQIQAKIEKNWPHSGVTLYFAQVLSGECSIKETVEDLLSLDEPTQAADSGRTK